MKLKFLLAIVAVAGPTAAHAAPVALSLQNTYTATGFFADGLDFSTGKTHYTIVLPDGAWGTAPDQGKVVVLNKNLNLAVSTFTSRLNTDFQGIATIDANDRVIALENDPAAHAYSYNANNGTQYWDASSYAYPGTYFMGAAIGNVAGSTTPLEVVVADYDGYIEVLNDTNTGGVVASYDLGAQYGEGISGHVSLANFVGSASSPNEIVVVGSTTGRVFVLQVSGTTMTVPYVSAPMPNGGFADGTGPAVADIDGDNRLDIVVASSGAGTIRSYATNWGTGCKYVWSTPGGADYYWGSPIIGNVYTGNALANEVVVQSVDSVVSVLSVGTGNSDSAGHSCKEGTVVWTHTIGSGGDSWYTPSIAGDLSGDGGYEIVAASYSTVEVIDGDLGTASYDYTDATAQFTGNAMVDATNGANPRTDIVVAGWNNGTVYRLQTPRGVSGTTEWTGYMGGPRHTGQDN